MIRARARLFLALGLGLELGASAAGRSALAQPAPAGAVPKRPITPPKLVHFVEAAFPPSELAAEKSATVTLQIAIAVSGQVASVEVAAGAGPAFDEAAVAAAKQFVFEPAEVDGKAIPVRITYRYEFTWTPTLVKRTTGDFDGLVRERKNKKPVADVTVSLDTGVRVVTGADGRFTFADVAPGTHTVTLEGARVTTVATTEEIEASKKLEATYEVDLAVPGAADEEKDDLEVVVTAPRMQKQVVSTEVSAVEGAKVPGTQGDVLKVVEDMPGVARSAVGSGALVVWGAAPADTRVYIDDVPVPRLYHDGGYRSVMQSDMVRGVSLIPGGYGPSYGRGLGGLVTVQMRRLDEPGFHGSAGADTLDAGASVRAAVTDDLHVAIGARKSYLDSVVHAVTKEDVGDVVPLPRYYDGQARLTYRLGARETLELGGLLSSDTTDHTLLGADPSTTKRQTTTLDFGRVYLRYENRLASGATIAVVPSWGKDLATLTSRFGATPTNLRNDASVFGVRASYQGPTVGLVTWLVGLDANVTSATLGRTGSIGAPPREGDIYVFGQAPSDQVNADTWKTVIASLGAYAEADVALADGALHVVPGVRFDPYLQTTSRLVPVSGDDPSHGYARQDTELEPRLSVRFAASPRVSVKAAFGVYHQPPQAEDLSAVFGAPQLGPASGEHYVLGGAFKLTDTLDFETTAFLTESHDLTSRSAATQPGLAQALVQDGSGRAFGTQFLLRQRTLGPFFGWVSYSIQRSERRDHPGADYRLFDYDQTHVLTALGSVDLGHGFELGARFRVATGFPRTPVTGASYDALSDAYVPRFGPQNSVRIPAFIALDARLAKHIKAGTTEGEVYLDVQNVTNHQNPEELVYDPTYRQRATITGLPILPVVGLRWTW